MMVKIALQVMLLWSDQTLFSLFIYNAVAEAANEIFRRGDKSIWTRVHVSVYVLMVRIIFAQTLVPSRSLNKTSAELQYLPPM